MRLKSKVCTILVVLLVLGGFNAFAEQYSWTPDLQREETSWTPDLQRNTTPELGDHSVATVTLASLSVLTLAGAIVAHKKVRSNAL